jgi:glycosyltransferase involved in cell wall biosynthesis
MADRAVAAGAHLVTPTAAVAAELASVLPDLNPARIHPLGAGITPSLRAEPGPERRAEVLARHELDPGYLMCLATLEPRKGLDVLLDAAAELGPDAPRLVLVGPRGWGGIDLDAEIARRGLDASRIRVLGLVTDADLAVLLRAARLLVMPSRAEGFGLPVAEAMAVGTPVICSDVPALVEVGGGAVQVVPRGDPSALAVAIREIWGDELRLGAMAKAGVIRSGDFDWNTVAQRTWALYAKVGSE